MATAMATDSGNKTGGDATLLAQEQAVSITAFAAPKVPGFRCVLKHRYTDFLVNEILPDGQVLHLTELSNKTPGRTEHVNGNGNGAAGEVATETGTDVSEPSLDTNGQSSSKRKGREDENEADPVAEETSTFASHKKQKLDEDVTSSEANSAPNDSTATSTAIKDRVSAIVVEVTDADKQSLHDIFGEAVTKKVLHLYAQVVLHPERKPREQPSVQSDVISEKSKRTDAHVAVRRIFSSKLETATMQDQQGVISIKASSTKSASGARGRAPIGSAEGALQKGRLVWDELGGEFLHFTLYKENKDTMEVLYYIASQLKVPVKNFQFAGTKDRRAVTVQRIAVFRIHGSRLAGLNKAARGWRVGNFAYKPHGLELGELGGNEFLLTLRDCHFMGEESLVHEQRLILARRILENATKSLREFGYVNYFGLQRFGSFSTGTHIPGQKMLSGDLEGAINAILNISDESLLADQHSTSGKKVPQDDIDRAEAIQLWRDGKAGEASRLMPKRFQAEREIIHYLTKKDRKTGRLLQERDWQGALTHIPRNLRLMYVHAYQSLVWNRVASQRMELFGNRVVEGDLVVVGEKDAVASSTRDEVDQDGEPIFHPAEEDSAPNAESSYTQARPLSQAEAGSGKYDVFDIVLPLPGYDVLYPANALGQFYAEFMGSESGGGIDPHNMRRSWKDISLSGAYRKVMARPVQELRFEVKGYVEDEQQMVETDLEKLQKGGAEQGKSGQEANGSKEAATASTAAKKVAVVLQLQLGSSQYATMALRELTKGGAAPYQPDYSSR